MDVPSEMTLELSKKAEYIDRAEGKGGQGQVEAAQTQGRKRDERPDGTRHRDCQEQAPPRIAAERLPHGEGTDPHEGQLAQRDLTGKADEQHERETDDAERQPLRERREGGRSHNGRQNDHHRDQEGGTSHRLASGGHPGDGPHGQAPGGGQPRRRDHEQCHEEEDDRNHLDEDGGEAGVDVAGKVALGVVGDEAEDERADKGHGKAAQPADHGSREPVQGQERQLDRRQPGLSNERSDEHAGEGCEHEAQHPPHLRQPVGLRAGQRDELGIVDNRAHGDAEPGPAQEQAQGDAHDRGDDHDHDLLVLQRDTVGPEQMDRQDRAVRLGEVGRHGADDVGAAPENGGDAQQYHQEAERHHERPLHGGTVDAPEEHELDDECEEWCLHEDDEHDGEQEGPVLVLPQLPIRERRDHAHGALGEVEDASRVVGHDEADGQEAVDRTEDDAEDSEREEDAHRFTSSPLRNPQPRRWL